MVRCSHYHAHVIGGLGVLGVIGIECPVPHGGPHKVTAQPQYQFKALGVELMAAALCAECVLYPCGQARSLIVQEYAAVCYCGLACGVCALGQ